MRNLDWHTNFCHTPAKLMNVRIMVIVGLAALLLAFIMLARMSRTIPSPLSAKPVGTSTLSHGDPPVAPASRGLPDRPGDRTRDQEHLGDAK